MKLYFDKLNVPPRTVEISFDGGNTFTTYNKSTLRSGSLDVPNSVSSFSQIIIRGGGFEDTPWYETDSLNNKAIKNKVSKVLIPNGVTEINSHAFYNCTRLTSINIPSSVAFISHKDNVYYGCTSLTSINVDEGNTNYSSEDGVVYNKDKTQLVVCPQGKTSVTIPSSVTSIGELAICGCTGLTSINIPSNVTSIGIKAFLNCTSLTSITIQNGVTSIGGSAFYNCTSLTSINIPNSVTSIGTGAFRDCASLATINYTGTQAQWNAINKGSNWNKNCPANMEINCDYQG